MHVAVNVYFSLLLGIPNPDKTLRSSLFLSLKKELRRYENIWLSREGGRNFESHYEINQVEMIVTYYMTMRD